MTRDTVAKLNELNRRFYQAVHMDFSRTRQAPWPGWIQLKSPLKNLPQPFSVLDVGCGNARFGRFLESEGYTFEYEGVDNSPDLLHETGEFPAKTGDFVTDSLGRLVTKPDYDLVVMFGVLHHIPGIDTRKKLLEEAARLVRPSGLLILSMWQFAADSRFTKKFKPWSSVSINEREVETGDYLLPWGDTTALRYVHQVSEEEEQALIASVDMPLVEAFEADGKSGHLNRYLLFNRVT
jgi:tRNA (uracil-5-)-methyltransferase TRM9